MIRRRVVLVAVVALASLAGCKKAEETSSGNADRIPTAVFGGGSPVVLTVTASCRARVHVGFQKGRTVEDHQSVFADQVVDAGRHTFTISVPENVMGGFEATLVQPKTGDSVEVLVEANGRSANDAFTLEGDPTPGYSAFAQLDFDDVLTLAPDEG